MTKVKQQAGQLVTAVMIFLGYCFNLSFADVQLHGFAKVKL